MNTVILTGRIASELELKKTPSDASVCSFRIAVNRRFKNAEGKYDADFISCVAWRNTADFVAKYFSKGEPIEVRGSLQTRSYEKDDGQTVYITEVVVDDVGFTVLPKKTDGQNDTAIKSTNTHTSSNNFLADGFEIVEEEDLPFL